jgi:predicted TIM-barrel fold metal-dependent hydrolase
MEGRPMTDNHVHIGQYNAMYYEPLEIIETVMGAGMEGLAFSSTTTCKELVEYREIETEIDRLLGKIRYSPETVPPYLWYIPAYIAQGITIKRAISNLPYRGIKIHPLAHHWDFDDHAHITALHEIFGFAQDNAFPVLLHTGEDTIFETEQLCYLANTYPQLKIILAHCRPMEQTLKLLKQYSNVYCDTAFYR